MSVRVGQAQRSVKSIFKTYIDCLHLQKTDKSRLHVDDSLECNIDSSNRGDTEEDSQEYQDKVDKLKELSKLSDIYVEMRKRGNSPGSSKKVITATVRQIESLIRLGEALARMYFSEMVEKWDVIEAFRLLEVAMQQSASDHATGTIAWI